MDKLEKWMTVVIIMNMTMAIINAAGFFPMQNTLGDSAVGESMDNIQSNYYSVKEGFNTSDNIVDYTFNLGKALYNGIKIIISVLSLIFTALEPLALLLRMPSALYVPIQLVVDVMIIYNFGKLLFNR
jgi:hypothetical protein